MPRLIVKENYYEGPCGHASDPEKISEVSEDFCKAMSGDLKLRKKCEDCKSSHRLCKRCRREGRRRSVALDSDGNGFGDNLCEECRKPPEKPEPKGGNYVPETPTAKSEDKVVVKPATPPVIFTPVPPTRYGRSPKDLEARARIGQRALEMSLLIDEAAKAEYGGAASMARTLKMSESRAAQLRRLQRLHPEVKKMLEEGHLAVGTGAALALYSQPVQPVLVEGLKNGKVTVGSLSYGPLHDALKQGKLKERMEALGLEWPESEE